MRIAFARKSGQPVHPSIFDWHPRDLDTWLALGAKEAQDARFSELHKQGG